MQSVIIDFFIPGAIIGITAALTPGPLMALIVSETIRGGIKAGVKVSVAPLCTDVPFIVFAIILAKSVESSPVLLACISFIGAAFLVYVALQNLTIQKHSFNLDQNTKGSLYKGIVMNLMNPNMYIWWFSVATPFFVKGSIAGSTMFASALLIFSISTMMLLSLSVSKARVYFLKYAHVLLKALGLGLLFFAWKLLQQGLTFLS